MIEKFTYSSDYGLGAFLMSRYTLRLLMHHRIIVIINPMFSKAGVSLQSAQSLHFNTILFFPSSQMVMASQSAF